MQKNYSNIIEPIHKNIIDIWEEILHITIGFLQELYNNFGHPSTIGTQYMRRILWIGFRMPLSIMWDKDNHVESFIQK